MGAGFFCVRSRQKKGDHCGRPFSVGAGVAPKISRGREFRLWETLTLQRYLAIFLKLILSSFAVREIRSMVSDLNSDYYLNHAFQVIFLQWQ